MGVFIIVLHISSIQLSDIILLSLRQSSKSNISTCNILEKLRMLSSSNFVFNKLIYRLLTIKSDTIFHYL